VNLAAGLSVEVVNGSAPAGPGIPALYAGSAPKLPCGVVQINLRVPTDIEPGVYQFFPRSLMALAGGAESVIQGTVGVTISVK
jgi:uncharacterized protein (TIGR03437 family)